MKVWARLSVAAAAVLWGCVCVLAIGCSQDRSPEKKGKGSPEASRVLARKGPASGKRVTAERSGRAPGGKDKSDRRGSASDGPREVANDAGEDPFAITDAVTKHVKRLMGKYRPQTELEKAIALYRSILPRSAWFELKGKRHRGLAVAEGGLEIAFDDDLTAPLRKRHGSLLPSEILQAPARERVADCLEYSFVLIALLRAASIDASFGEKPDHAFVVTVLDGQTYGLDPANRTFAPFAGRGEPDRVGLAVHYSNEGVILKEQGRLDEAIRCLERAIALRPGYAQAFVNKGLALREKGNLDQAIAAYDRALRIDPRDARAWSNKGVALGQQGKLEQAVACHDRALVFKPDYHKPWNNKGIVHFRKGEMREAVKCYDRALGFKPDYVKAWYNKGLALRAQGDLDGAIKCFEKALEIKPDKALAWYSKGVALQKQGKPRQAKQCFDRAKALGAP